MDKEIFLVQEKVRIGRLYSTKHKKGFSTRELFVNWYETQLRQQDFKCYYCDTSIFIIRALIEQDKIPVRKTGYGERGRVLEIDKKDNPQGYTKENCVLSCYYCNNDKSYTLGSDDYKKHFGENRKRFFTYLEKSIKQ